MDREFARPTVEQIQAEVHRASEREDDGRYGDAMEVLADIIRPWEDTHQDAAEPIAYAMVLSAQTAVRAGPNIDAAHQVCDEVLKRFSDSEDPGVRAMVVWALTVEGWVHACAEQLRRGRSSIRASHRIRRRQRRSADPGACTKRPQAARASRPRPSRHW